MVSHSDSQKNKIAEFSGSRKSEMAGSSANLHNQLPDHMLQVPRKLEGQNSEIVWSGDPSACWSGDSSICCKNLKHYPAFSRNETTIDVYSFAFIMTEEENYYLGYLEDMFEDKRRQKKVKVRWFQWSQELNSVRPRPHPKEVIITPTVQVMGVECIVGIATVLTPRHYEQCMALVSEESSSGVYMCSRQIKNNKVKPFTLSKLHGYSNQAIFSFLDFSLDPEKLKQAEEKEKEDVDQQGVKGIQISAGLVTDLVSDHQVANTRPTHQKLKIKLSSKGSTSIKFVGSEPQPQVLSFNVDEEIEVLSQDSGMHGCWFRCKILQVSASNRRLKVLYKDVKDVEGPGNLEEWLTAHRVAASDKLGSRCSGRHTTRPCPPKNTVDTSLSIGSPVDAWWCDGWWEGVVVGINVRRNIYRVYFPGEDRFENIQKKHLRTSRDWIENKWVDIKSKPDILSFISSNFNSKMTLQTCSTLRRTCASGSGFSSVDNKVVASSVTGAEE